MTAETNPLALTPSEAAYVVGALKLVLDHYDERLTERDRDRIASILHRLAERLDLSEDVRFVLDS